MFYSALYWTLLRLVDPYIVGITPVSSSNVKLPPFGNENKFRTQLHTQYSQNMISSYAWIPSVFRISPDGTDAHIESYINGLGTREQYPGLFRVIEQMFLLALPHFEKTLRTSYEYRAEYSPSGLLSHFLNFVQMLMAWRVRFHSQAMDGTSGV